MHVSKLPDDLIDSVRQIWDLPTREDALKVAGQFLAYIEAVADFVDDCPEAVSQILREHQEG